MGLDSVELLMEIENYFGIRIPDQEAEKLYTIQKMIDSVASHLNITNENTELRNFMFQKIEQGINEIQKSTNHIGLSDKIAQFISPENKENWKAFSNYLNLQIPKPGLLRKGDGKLSDKIKNLISWTPNYDWNSITVEEFISAICANNYEELIDRTNIKCKYEIKIAVVGITVNKVGVDYYEATPEKSFTNDLGVD